MSQMIVGDGYKVLDTPRNRLNGLIAGKEARIAHVNNTHVSVTIIQDASYKKLLIPLDAFGANFGEDRQTMINKGYKSLMPHKELYK